MFLRRNRQYADRCSRPRKLAYQDALSNRVVKFNTWTSQKCAYHPALELDPRSSSSAARIGNSSSSNATGCRSTACRASSELM